MRRAAALALLASAVAPAAGLKLQPTHLAKAGQYAGRLLHRRQLRRRLARARVDGAAGAFRRVYPGNQVYKPKPAHPCDWMAPGTGPGAQPGSGLDQRVATSVIEHEAQHEGDLSVSELTGHIKNIGYHENSIVNPANPSINDVPPAPTFAQSEYHNGNVHEAAIVHHEMDLMSSESAVLHAVMGDVPGQLLHFTGVTCPETLSDGKDYYTVNLELWPPLQTSVGTCHEAHIRTEYRDWWQLWRHDYYNHLAPDRYLPPQISPSHRALDASGLDAMRAASFGSSSGGSIHTDHTRYAEHQVEGEDKRAFYTAWLGNIFEEVGPTAGPPYMDCGPWISTNDPHMYPIQEYLFHNDRHVRAMNTYHVKGMYTCS